MKIKFWSTMSKLKFLLIVVFIVSGCATVDSQPSKVFHQLGVAYYEKGEYDAALEQFKKQGEVKEDLLNYAWIGATYHKKRQYKDAISYFQKAGATGGMQFTTRDFGSKIFGKLANCYNNLNQYTDASTACHRAIHRDYGNGYAHFQLALAYFKMKLPELAVREYEIAIKYDPKDPTYYNGWGVLLIDSENYAGAVEQFKKAVSLKPNNRTYLLNLAGAFYRQGKYDEALNAVDKTVLLMSFAGIGAGLQIVEIYPVVTTVDDPSPAKKAGIKAGDKIIKIDGKTIKGWKLNDVISDIKGQEGTSVVFLIERKDTKNPLEIAVIRENIIQKEASPVFGIRSLILRYIGKKQESLKDAKQAYSLDSSGKWAQVALGAAYLDNGRSDEAVKLLSQVKKSTHARILEATAYAKKGDFKKTINIYFSIPEEKLSQKNVPLWSDRIALLEAFRPLITSKIQNATTLKTQGRYKEALNELGDALKVADDTTSKEICGSIYRIMSMDPKLSELPEEARKYALRGDVLTEEGKFEGAAKEYLHAVQAAPYIAKLYFNTAMIYGELQRHPQAIRHMKTYLNLAPEAPNARAAQDQIYKWEFAMEKRANGGAE